MLGRNSKELKQELNPLIWFGLAALQYVFQLSVDLDNPTAGFNLTLNE